MAEKPDAKAAETPPAPDTAPRRRGAALAEAKATPLPVVKREPLFVQARKFSMLDGRPITIVRHAVCFFCPVKDAPDIATLVSLKGGKSAVPLAITYVEFKAWWMAK